MIKTGGLDLKEAIYALNYMRGKQPLWAAQQWIYLALNSDFITENTNRIGWDC